MNVTLNGEAAILEEGSSVADVVALLGHDPTRPGVAVALDGVVVRRPLWAASRVADGAVVEVLTAVQGGAR